MMCLIHAGPDISPLCILSRLLDEGYLKDSVIMFDLLLHDALIISPFGACLNDGTQDEAHQWVLRNLELLVQKLGTTTTWHRFQHHLILAAENAVRRGSLLFVLCGDDSIPVVAGRLISYLLFFAFASCKWCKGASVQVT